MGRWAWPILVAAAACHAPSPSSPDAGVTPDAGTAREADAGPKPRARVRVLFIGNSLTSTNDLPAAVAALARSHVQAWEDIQVEAVAPGGKLLTGHLEDLRKTGTPLAGLLAPASQWDFVVLQEQSQVPGLDPADPYRQASISAAVDLAAAARDAGATPVLYMTWGFWSGDASNADLFPDFPSMSARIEQGYVAMAQAIQPPPRVAPVGLAFRAAYADTPDALAAASPFRRLYQDDRHPTPLGTFLASAVIVGTLSGERVSDADYRPAGVSGQDAARALRWADEVVFDGRYADAP